MRVRLIDTTSHNTRSSAFMCKQVLHLCLFASSSLLTLPLKLPPYFLFILNKLAYLLFLSIDVTSSINSACEAAKVNCSFAAHHNKK